MQRQGKIVAAAGVGLLLVGSAAWAAGGHYHTHLSQVGTPGNSAYKAITTTSGGGGTAGMLLEVPANIKDVSKKSMVVIDASWQWTPGPYSANHPCALVNVTPQYGLPNLFGGAVNYLAEVVITTDKAGDVLIGNISGGSVCEVEVFGSAQSINQWLIAFEIDPSKSTGKFAGRTGQGLIDFKYNSKTFAFEQPFQITMNRWHEKK